MAQEPITNLTNSQRLIWTGQQLTPDSPLYNMSLVYTINGKIDVVQFCNAFKQLVDSSESLRSVADETDGVVRSRVLEKLSPVIETIDFSKEPNPSKSLHDWADRRCKFSFDLTKKSFDSAIIKLGQEQFAWYYNQHHLFTDATSFQIIFDEVQQNYQSLLQGSTRTVDSLPVFKEFVAFEKKLSQNNKASREWFASKRSLVPPPLYGFQPLPKSATTRSRRVTLPIGKTRSEKIRHMAMEPGVRSLTQHLSQFNLFATVLFAFLRRVSGQQKIAIGTPAHNRSTKALKKTIGLLIEVFPVSVELEDEETFASLQKKIQVESTSFLRFAQPGASGLGSQRSFNTLLNYITASFGDFCSMPTRADWLHSGHCDSGHALRLQIHDFDAQGEFVLHFDFNEVAFDKQQQQDAIEHFENILDAMLEDFEQTIDAVSILGRSEWERLTEMSQTPARATGVSNSNQPSDDETLLDKIRTQVINCANQVATQMGDEQTTYLELRNQVNSLAAAMEAKGVKQGDFVAICLGRSPAAIVAILAAWEIGAAFVPIDRKLPCSRIEFMLTDTDAKLLIVEQKQNDSINSTVARLCLDANGGVDSADGVEHARHSPTPTVDKNETAYLIYTSGSTGKPKGVEVSHGNIEHYISWAKSEYANDGQALNCPFFTPLSFDLTLTSIFLPLVTGGRVFVYPEPNANADLSILDVLEDDQVNIVKLTPSHLSLFKGKPLGRSKIKKLILGGENLRTDVAKEVARAFDGDVDIYNEYGPTEATVGCIVHSFDPSSDLEVSVPIGKPISNMSAFVLNNELQPVPQGVVGELFLAGNGVAKGYWNRPELTDERFVKHLVDPSQRMYRTGDLARIRKDGTFEYHGRCDQQVKVRGVRIELGEIESVLNLHPDVSESHVTFSSQNSRSESQPEQFCTRCGLASNYPDVKFDSAGICQLCSGYETYREKAEQYFRSMDELQQLFGASRKVRERLGSDQPDSYDCISLLSGGKDSTYMLSRLKEMGLRVLAFTLDNGYISDQAKSNINRVVQSLGVDHVYGETPAMNAIFVDSLNRHANVCQGCFKTIYTLSMKLAKEKGIPFIVTGLSRGQFFETRLTEELFASSDLASCSKPDLVQLDATILRARKEYHRVDDAVSQLLDVEIFEDDEIFNEVQLVDFYRYCDVELDEMLTHLDQRVPWIRPSDTGRSTNCLINDVGIYVHKKERGFHNYALPYSWDVRVGHKQRDAALEELDDQIDVGNAERILDEIGYQSDSEQKLVAYYTSANPIAQLELKQHLANSLPEYMLPTHIVHLETIPLTSNGKVDTKSLPVTENQRQELRTSYVAPRSKTEIALTEIWQTVLRVDRVGIQDNFFDIGGDSIMAIQIIGRANQAGLKLTPSQLFDNLTVEKLATVASSVSVQAEQGAVTGPVELTPIQKWHFDSCADDSRPGLVCQTVRAVIPADFDIPRLQRALAIVIEHHDALRIAYVQNQNGWSATGLVELARPVEITKFAEADFDAQFDSVSVVTDRLAAKLDLALGQLIQVGVIQSKLDQELVFVADHLSIDAASWTPLLEDLFSTYDQLEGSSGIQPKIKLPSKTTSFQQWSAEIFKFANSDELNEETVYWNEAVTQTKLAQTDSHARFPFDFETTTPNEQRYCVEKETKFDSTTTKKLMSDLSVANRQHQDVLLAALAMTISQWSKQSVVQIDVEAHGRNPFSETLDVSRTVGWFTSLYPVVIQSPTLESNENYANVVDKVKDQLRLIPGQGRGFGLLRYLNKKQSLATFPKSNILFNFLGKNE